MCDLRARDAVISSFSFAFLFFSFGGLRHANTIEVALGVLAGRELGTSREGGTANGERAGQCRSRADCPLLAPAAGSGEWSGKRRGCLSWPRHPQLQYAPSRIPRTYPPTPHLRPLPPCIIEVTQNSGRAAHGGERPTRDGGRRGATPSTGQRLRGGENSGGYEKAVDGVVATRGRCAQTRTRKHAAAHRQHESRPREKPDTTCAGEEEKCMDRVWVCVSVSESPAQAQTLLTRSPSFAPSPPPLPRPRCPLSLALVCGCVFTE